MKAKDIEVGGLYVAEVSGKLTTVRVDKIRDWWNGQNKLRTVFDVTDPGMGPSWG